jgi:P-type E1-E2 ATPase
LIIESAVLPIILADEVKKSKFLLMSKLCDSVICARASPGQKAEIISAIKQHDQFLITAAIGDGANDVSMIKEAHVGIGLYGNEGLRAV